MESGEFVLIIFISAMFLLKNALWTSIYGINSDDLTKQDLSVSCPVSFILKYQRSFFTCLCDL